MESLALAVTLPPMPDAAHYLLAWPRALFVEEATAVLEQFIGPPVIDACTVPLQEAFCGREPVLDFDAEARGTFGSTDSQRAFVQSLIDQAEKTPQQEDRLIWPDRHRVVGPAEMSDRRRQLPRAFTDLATNFHDRGYFDRSFGDSLDNLDPDLVLAERLGATGSVAAAARPVGRGHVLRAHRGPPRSGRPPADE